MQKAVLFQLFVQQQDAEKELVHPVIQGIHVYMLFFQFHFRGGTRQSFSGTYIPTIPEDLLHFEHHLILVFRNSLDVEIRDFDRQPGDVTLVRGLAGQGELGQVTFSGIGEVVPACLFYQSVLPDQRIIVLRPSLALLQRELGMCQHGGKRKGKKENGSFHIHSVSCLFYMVLFYTHAKIKA